MKIYGKNKQLILDVEVDDSSYRHHVVMGEHNIMLKYSLAEHVEIPVGAYCVFQGETYTLERPESFKMRHRRAFEYSVLMEAAQYKAKVWKFVNPIDGRIKFSLTARPREHLQMLIDNLNEREPERWTIGKCLDDVERVITYDNAYCWDAISQMAEEFGTEFEFRGREVSLRKVEYNTNNPLPLSYGKGNGIKPGTSRSNPTEQTISKLYVQGGERNIDSSKYGASQLHLPKGGRIAFDGDKFEGDEGFVKARSRTYVADNKGYSIRRSDIPQVLGAEDSFDCSYIYPSRIGTISEVVVVNNDKNFYDIIDNTIPLLLNYASCVIAGETLSIVFQSGMLAGKEFDVKYIDAAGGGKKGQRFEIVPQEVDGQTMPNETFAPRVGDKYAVFHCMLPNSYIRDDRNKLGAEWNMMRQAVRYLYNRENEGYVYSLSVDEIWAKRNWTQLQDRIILGGMILFSDESFQVQGVRLRITGIKDYINAPNKIEIELSANLVRGSLSRKIQRIDDSKWGKVDDVYRNIFLCINRDIRESFYRQKTIAKAMRIKLTEDERVDVEDITKQYRDNINKEIELSDSYRSIIKELNTKENSVEELEQIDLSLYYHILQTMIFSGGTDAPLSYCVNTYQGEEIKLYKASSIPLGSRLVFRCIGKKLDYCPESELRIVDLTARSKIISEKRDVYSASSGLSIYGNNSEPWGYKVCEFKGIDWRAEFIRSQDSCGTPIWIWKNYNDSYDLKTMSETVATQVSTATGQQQVLDILQGKMGNALSQIIDINNLSIDHGQQISHLSTRVQNLETQTLKKSEGLALGFINLLNYNGGVYTVKETDYHILARKTGNGDAYPYIKVSENLPHGHRFVVDMPYSECRVRLVLPSGGVTWGNGGIEWTHGYRYEVVKSNYKEWGVIKTAYA